MSSTTSDPDAAFVRPIVVIDVVLLTLADGRLKVALPARTKPPFAGMPALIGGYVHPEEDDGLEPAAARILTEKTGLSGIYAEQLGTFAGPRRDPRGWSVCVAYLALVPVSTLLVSTVDMNLLPVDELPPLPFDHADIVEAAVGRLRGKGAYSSLPTRLLPETFTFQDLHDVYQRVIGTTIDHSSFRRKVTDLGMVEETGTFREGRSKRPPALYRLSPPYASGSTFDRTLGQSQVRT